MTCKDCVHCEACKMILRSAYPDVTEAEIIQAENNQTKCVNFKDKSRFIELPCKVGDKIYKIWGCGKSGKSISEFIVSHIDIDYYPEIEISFTKEHSKTGYYYFAKLCDIGKTVFLTREEAEEKLKENSNA